MRFETKGYITLLAENSLTYLTANPILLTVLEDGGPVRPPGGA